MKTFITARMDQSEIKRLTAAGFKVEQGGFAITGVKMDKDSLISKLAEVEVAIIEFESTVARLKLKGIDGDPHKRWMMWIS